jgi:hypothetical protein
MAACPLSQLRVVGYQQSAVGARSLRPDLALTEVVSDERFLPTSRSIPASNDNPDYTDDALALGTG